MSVFQSCSFLNPLSSKLLVSGGHILPMHALKSLVLLGFHIQTSHKCPCSHPVHVCD